MIGIIYCESKCKDGFHPWNPWKTPEPSLGMNALAFWTMRGWDVAWNLLCPDTNSSQRNGFSFCHWASRRSIWYGLAGNRLSLAGWEGRAGWQTEPGQDPTDTRSWLSSGLTPASKRPLDEELWNPSSPCNHSLWLFTSAFQSSVFCVFFFFGIFIHSDLQKTLEEDKSVISHCWQMTPCVKSRVTL